MTQIIGIDQYLYYALIALPFLLIAFSAMLFMAVKNNAPDAFVHWAAKRKGQPVCRVHYKGKNVRDYIAATDPIEKDMGTPYWRVPSIGIKFKPEPDDIQFIEGSIRCANYFENIPEAQKIHQVVAYSQLKDYFKKIGMNIEGVENVALYVASEAEKTTPEQAIINARIDSEETKKYIKKYLNAINMHKKELERLKLESGVFTFQTAMKALDSTIAYTSSHIAHTKEVIKAAIKRQQEDDVKKYFMYIIVTAFVDVIIGYALSKV